jgi:uncharacterized protein
VKAELQQLIALQIADTSIRKLQAELEFIPKRRAEVESEFDQRAFEFKALEQARDAARAARQQLDKDLAEQRTRAEKADRDLMSSTNPKVYEAAIREADAAKKRINELETKILEQMEAGDQAERSLAESEPELQRLRGEFDERLKTFEEQTAAQAAEIEARRADRERIFSELTPTARSLYNRISARIRDGVALAEARNGSCSACFMALRPQIMAQVRRGEEIIQCDNCNRILYHLPAEQAQSAN